MYWQTWQATRHALSRHSAAMPLLCVLPHRLAAMHACEAAPTASAAVATQPPPNAAGDATVAYKRGRMGCGLLLQLISAVPSRLLCLLLPLALALRLAALLPTLPLLFALLPLLSCCAGHRRRTVEHL